MKKLLTILAVLTLTSTSFAHEGKHPRPGKKKATTVVVKGKRAKAIYNALDADVITKNRPKFSADIKKVAGLRCAKLTKKADTKVVKFRCAVKGKKLKPGRRNGRRGQGRRGQNN